MSQSITSIVITGGPCSGKSTGMSYLAKKLGEIGFGVLVVPELPTEVIVAGAVPRNTISLYDFQEMLVLEKLSRERFYRALAQKIKSEKVVILFDRAVLDAKAYIDEDGWKAILHDNDLQEITLRDRYYDAIIHLRSAAIGPQEFYTRENNSARLETPEEAAEKCEKTLQAWVGHPHLHVIDNTTNFESKMRRVLQAVLHTLGEPIPLEIEKKYLVDPTFREKDIPCSVTVTEIEQVYLPNGFRIRKRGKEGAFIYTKTHKQETSDTRVRIEKEVLISAREYSLLMEERLVDIPEIKKRRVCFVYEDQYFELDFFTKKELTLLEIELTDRHKIVSLPDWLPIIRDVTAEEEYRNISIAQSM